MNENKVGNLAKAVAQVSKSVGSLSPDKRNKEQNYDYISADKALSSIGKEMAAHGIAILPSVSESDSQTIAYTSYGKDKSRIDARVIFNMEIVHESGESLSRPWVGYGTDYVTPDKAIYKAITSGHKYFLFKLFNVGIGNEDGEHEHPPIEQEPQRKPLLNTGRIQHLIAIGKQAYGDEWSKKHVELVNRVSGGNAEDVAELLPEQLETLIAGIEKKLATVQHTNGAVGEGAQAFSAGEAGAVEP